MAKELKLSPVGLYTLCVEWSDQSLTPMYQGAVSGFNRAQEVCDRHNRRLLPPFWTVKPVYPSDDED